MLGIEIQYNDVVMQKTINSWKSHSQAYLPAICAGFFALLYLGIVLSNHSWDPLSLVRIGGHFDPRVIGQEMGYDGQFGYQIASDPSQAWKYVDLPAYRYQRILYPILVRTLSLGQVNLIPWMLMLVNLVTFAVSMILLVKILRFYNHSGWYSLIYGLFIGTLMSIRLDLNEVLAYTLVISAVYLWINNRNNWAMVCFALAILTKEITLIFLAGFALSAFVHHPLKGIRIFLLGVLPFILLKIGLFIRFQDWGANAGGAMATSFEWIPYFGWWKLALINLKNFALVSILIFPLAIFPSIAGLVFGIRNFWKKQFDPATICLFLSALLIPFLPSSNLLDPLGLSRALMSLVLAYLYFAASKNNSRLLKYLLLFCVTALFIWGDSFLPVGTYRP
jgi:hypothetical protein